MGSIKIGNTLVNNVKIGNTQVQKVYLGTTLIWSFVNYSTELQAIINRANTEGFALPSAATLTIMDTLISAIKTAGVWNKLDRFFNFAYNNASLTNFSRIDWKNPSTSALATVNGGVTYLVSGFKGNAIDGYVDTGFMPSTHGVNYTLNNASRTAVVYTAPTTGNILDGSTGSANNVMALANSAAQRINTSNALTGGTVGFAGNGLKSINRDNSTDIRLYNISTEFLRTATSTILPNLNQVLFRSAATAYSDTVISQHMMGASLTATEVANFRTAYNNYLTSIGLTAVA